MASTRYTGLIKKALKQKKKNKASFLSNLSCLMFDLPSFTKVNISRTLGCIPKTFDYLLPKGEYKVIMNPSDYNDIGVEFSLYSLISLMAVLKKLMFDTPGISTGY